MDPLQLTGVIVGFGYGYVAQRGAFCLSSGFRLVITQRDTTKLKAYALAVALQMLVLPALFAFHLSEPGYPLLFPVGAVVGGLLFGVSMFWAGGCAAGVWYKTGPGNLAALLAVLGMGVGAVALEVGPLRGLRTGVQSLGAVSSESLPDLLWAGAPVVGLGLLALLVRAEPGVAGAWTWRRTGLLMGLVGIVAWPLSSLAGRDFGIAVVPGTVTLGSAPLMGFSSWDVMFVLGIPLGALIAARVGGDLKLQRPSPKAAMKAFVGGLGLGVGASLAAGCTVGHGLTGIPLLAPGSFVAMFAIFAGAAAVGLWQKRSAVAATRPAG